MVPISITNSAIVRKILAKVTKWIPGIMGIMKEIAMEICLDHGSRLHDGQGARLFIITLGRGSPFKDLAAMILQRWGL